MPQCIICGWYNAEFITLEMIDSDVPIFESNRITLAVCNEHREKMQTIPVEYIIKVLRALF